MPDGCSEHNIATEVVDSRWETVERIIAATPEDDHGAQWSVIFMCICCYGPGKMKPEDTVWDTVYCMKCPQP